MMARVAAAKLAFESRCVHQEVLDHRIGA